MIQEERLVRLFLDLVSFNAPAREEREVVAWTERLLKGMGLEVWQDDAGAKIGGNANNLIARLPANREGAPKVFLSAHFDTVEPTEGSVVEEIKGVFVSTSDTILGADDKGGMAPAIEAVQALIESGEPHGDVYLLLSVAEEIGLLGADALDIQSLNLDFGYVLDTGPPVGSFVNRTATHDKLEVTIHGKPAHAGKDPENGINAIQVAARAIDRMRLGRIGPETTANLGLIEGGTAVNVVCAEVKLYGEARSTDVDALDEQIGHMIATFEEAATHYGATAEIHHGRHYGAYHVTEDAPVVKVAQAASRSLGLDPILRTNLGGSDANVYNAKGVPTLVVATGMDHIHTHDECISRQDLVNTARLAYALLIQSAKPM